LRSAGAALDPNWPNDNLQFIDFYVFFFTPLTHCNLLMLEGVNKQIHDLLIITLIKMLVFLFSISFTKPPNGLFIKS